jgi:hypothetical protein
MHYTPGWVRLRGGGIVDPGQYGQGLTLDSQTIEGWVQGLRLVREYFFGKHGKKFNSPQGQKTSIGVNFVQDAFSSR